MKKIIVREKSFRFALDAIELSKQLIESREFIISKQFLKSATSIGANIEESQSAESPKDFIHKLAIALKEARETKYWLLLLAQSEIANINYESYLEKIEEIISILVVIIKKVNAKI